MIVGLATGAVVGLRVGITADDCQPGGATNPMAGVAQDAASGKYFPANAAQWTTTMAAAGLATGNPSSVWGCQEAAGALADSIGSQALTASGTVAYQQPVSGLTRLGVSVQSAGAGWINTAGPVGLASTSTLVLAVLALAPPQATDRDIISIELGTACRSLGVSAGDKFKYYVNDGSATVTGTATPGTAAHVAILQTDRTNTVDRVVTEQEVLVQIPTTLPTHAVTSILIGPANAAGGVNGQVAYMVAFLGAAAELTTAQIRTLLQRLGWTVAW